MVTHLLNFMLSLPFLVIMLEIDTVYHKLGILQAWPGEQYLLQYLLHLHLIGCIITFNMEDNMITFISFLPRLTFARWNGLRYTLQFLILPPITYPFTCLIKLPPTLNLFATDWITSQFFAAVVFLDFKLMLFIPFLPPSSHTSAPEC